MRPLQNTQSHIPMDIIFHGLLMSWFHVKQQWDQGHVLGYVEPFGEVPSGLIDDDNGMRPRRDNGQDLLEMQVHGFGVAFWQNQGCADASGWTDGA